MKNIKKLLFSTSALATVAAPIAATVSCGKIGESFTGIGSNSVSPLIGNGAFANLNNPVGKYSYTNTGSGSGFGSQVAEKIKADFGMTSSLKRPGTQNEDKYGKKQDQIDNWAKNKIRTITWAIDAIAIGVNLPSGITITNNAVPQIDSTFLAKVYDGESVTWTDLLLNEAIGTSSTATVTPIYITGGESVSGKSEAFYKGMKKAAANANNAYGSNSTFSLKPGFEDHKTLTGNHGHSDSFTELLTDNNNTDGSIMYYSLGQILQEKSSGTSTSSNNIQIAAAKGFGANVLAPTSALAQNGTYKWTRPFNMIYSVDNKKSLEFATWLLGNDFQSEVEKIFVKLDPNDADVTTQKGNLDKPDFKLDANADGLNAKPNLSDAETIQLGLDV